MIGRLSSDGQFVLGRGATSVAMGFALVFGLWSVIQIFLFIDPFFLLFWPVIWLFSLVVMGIGTALIVIHLVIKYVVRHRRRRSQLRSARLWITRLRSGTLSGSGTLLLIFGFFFYFASDTLGVRKTAVEIAQEELRARGMNFSRESFRNALYFQNKLSLELFFKAGIDLDELYNVLERPAEFTDGQPLLQSLLEQVDCKESDIDEEGDDAACQERAEQFVGLLVHQDDGGDVVWDKSLQARAWQVTGFLASAVKSKAVQFLEAETEEGAPSSPALQRRFPLRKSGENGDLQLVSGMDRTLLSYALQFRAGHVAAELIKLRGPFIVEEGWLEDDFLETQSDAQLHNLALVDPFLLLADKQWLPSELKRLEEALCLSEGERWQPLDYTIRSQIEVADACTQVGGLLEADDRPPVVPKKNEAEGADPEWKKHDCNDASAAHEDCSRAWQLLEVVKQDGDRCSIHEPELRATTIHEHRLKGKNRKIIEGTLGDHQAILRLTTRDTEKIQSGQFFIAKSAEAEDQADGEANKSVTFRAYQGQIDDLDNSKFALENRIAMIRALEIDETTRADDEGELISVNYDPPVPQAAEDIENTKGQSDLSSGSSTSAKRTRKPSKAAGVQAHADIQWHVLTLDPANLLREKKTIQVEKLLTLEMTWETGDDGSAQVNQPPLCLTIYPADDEDAAPILAELVDFSSDREKTLKALLQPGKYIFQTAVADRSTNEPRTLRASFTGKLPRGLSCASSAADIDQAIHLEPDIDKRELLFSEEQELFCGLILFEDTRLDVDVSDFGDPEETDLDFDIVTFTGGERGETVETAAGFEDVETIDVSLYKGAYLLHLRAASGTLEQARLSIKSEPADFSNDPEPSIRSKALPLSLLPARGTDALYSGEIVDNDSSDVFSFDVAETQTVKFELRKLESDLEIRLYDEDGNQLSEGVSSSDTDETDMAPVTLEGGQRYYLSVDRVGSNSPYDIIAAGAEAGGQSSTENDLGQLSAQDQRSLASRVNAESEHRYAFELVERGFLEIELDPTNYDADLSLRTIEGVEIENSELLDLEQDRISRLLDPGRYVVVVHGLSTSTDFHLVISRGE